MNSTTGTQSRLAEIRKQWVCWSARTDTSTWESTFFFQVLDDKNREIRKLRLQLRRRLKRLSHL